MIPKTHLAQQWFWFGLFIRFLLMPISAHPDLFFNFVYTYPFLNQNIWDPYSYLDEYYHGQDYVNYYGPMAYYVQGLWSGLAQFFVGSSYDIWIKEILNPISNFQNEWFYSLPGSNSKFQTIFIWKSLYLIFDVGVLVCMLSLTKNEKMKEAYISLWAGSIILLYSLYTFGQSGIIPIGFIALGLFLHSRGAQIHWVGFIFSLSVPFKWFSILLLPLPFLIARGWKEKLKTLVFMLFPLAVMLIPLVIHSNGMALWLLTTGYATKSSEVSSSTLVSVLVNFVRMVGYIAICVHAMLRRGSSTEHLLKYIFILFLLLLCFPRKIHYFSWIVPFWFLVMHEKKIYPSIYIILVGLLFFTNLDTRPSVLGIFSPIDAELFMSMPSWMDITFSFFPSGIHEDISLLLIFVLTLTVVLDQILGLFDKEPLFYKENDLVALKFRSSLHLFIYPILLFICLLSLIFIPSTPLLESIETKLFIKTSSQYYRPHLKPIKLYPLEVVEQKLPVMYGRIHGINLFLDNPLYERFELELISIYEKTKKSIFKKTFESYDDDLLKIKPAFLYETSDSLFLTLKNVSNNLLSVSLRKLSIHQQGFRLKLFSKGGKKIIIPGAVLPLAIEESPQFIYDKDLVLGLINHSISNETGFLFFWFILLIICYFMAIRNYRLCKLN